MSKNFSESTEMRRLGLARLQYYAEDKCGDLRKLFETTKGLEKVCALIVADFDLEWDLRELNSSSYKHTPEGFAEIGKYVTSLGTALSKVACETEYTKKYIEIFGERLNGVEDVGFLLSEIGLSFSGLGALWRIVDPDVEYDMDLYWC